MRLPGTSIARIPFRNVLRSLQRTTLTVLAVGATSAVFFAVLGMLDSFTATIHAGEVSAEANAPDRISVDLDSVMPVASPTVQAVSAASSVSATDAGLRIPAMLLDSAEASFPAHGVVALVTDDEGEHWREEWRIA